MILTASKTLSLRKNHIISHLKGTLPNTYFYTTYYIYIFTITQKNVCANN